MFNRQSIGSKNGFRVHDARVSDYNSKIEASKNISIHIQKYIANIS